MALKAIISKDEHGKLSAELQAAYTTTDDGRYRVDVSSVDGWGLENIKGLKSAHEEDRGELRTVRDELKLWKELGVAPADAKAALAASKNLANMTPTEKVEEMRRALAQEYTAKYEGPDGPLTKANKSLAHLTGEVNRLTVDTEARAALIRAGVHAKRMDVALEIIRRGLKPDQAADGRYVARVIDAKGNPRISPKPGSSGDMTADELAEEMKASPDTDFLFQGTGMTGGGAVNGSTSRVGTATATSVPASVFGDSKRFAETDAALKAAGKTWDDVAVVPNQ